MYVMVTHVNEMSEVGQDHRSRLCEVRGCMPQSKVTNIVSPLSLSFRPVKFFISPLN